MLTASIIYNILDAALWLYFPNHLTFMSAYLINGDISAEYGGFTYAEKKTYPCCHHHHTVPDEKYEAWEMQSAEAYFLHQQQHQLIFPPFSVAAVSYKRMDGWIWLFNYIGLQRVSLSLFVDAQNLTDAFNFNFIYTVCIERSQADWKIYQSGFIHRTNWWILVVYGPKQRNPSQTI